MYNTNPYPNILNNFIRLCETLNIITWFFLFQEDSFTGVTIKSKKAKTPVRPALDYASSDNENNKSSNKVKVVFKNDTKRSKSTIKKIKSKYVLNNENVL